MSKRTRKPDLRPTIHRLYKVTLENSALYYLGRHSSKKDPDKDPYRGSGKWVKSIQDKSRLIIKTLDIYLKSIKKTE